MSFLPLILWSLKTSQFVFVIETDSDCIHFNFNFSQRYLWMNCTHTMTAFGFRHCNPLKCLLNCQIEFLYFLIVIRHSFYFNENKNKIKKNTVCYRHIWFRSFVHCLSFSLRKQPKMQMNSFAFVCPKNGESRTVIDSI